MIPEMIFPNKASLRLRSIPTLFYAFVCLEVRNLWILEPTENATIIEDRPATIRHAYPHFRKMDDFMFPPVIIVFGKEAASEGACKRLGDRVLIAREDC
jgi:hypothetical protein